MRQAKCDVFSNKSINNALISARVCRSYVLLLSIYAKKEYLPPCSDQSDHLQYIWQQKGQAECTALSLKTAITSIKMNVSASLIYAESHSEGLWLVWIMFMHYLAN